MVGTKPNGHPIYFPNIDGHSTQRLARDGQKHNLPET